MLRFLKRVAALAAALFLIAGLLTAFLLYPKYREIERIAESFDLAELEKIPAMSEVFDQAGMRYSRLAGEVRYVVPLDQISPHFLKAIQAREDSRFSDHHGVDYPGILRASIRNLKAGNVKEGASTITQQLARNTYSLDENRWRRKLIEAALALRIERHLSKDEIIEAYANRIYYGTGLYGVETASRACFGKSAKDLTLSEAAILAVLIRSPNRLSPLGDTRTALAERDQVLARMAALKMISAEEAAAARAEPMPLEKKLPPRIEENYAMDAVMRDLAILLPKDVVDRGGLKIYTTVDRRLQMLAEDAVDNKLSELEESKGWPHPKRSSVENDAARDTKANESPYVQGALIAIDNESGGIRAIVGGRKFSESPYNRALLAERQAGSTFKPFVYAAAFAKGMAPGTLVDDGPLQDGEVSGLAASWSPENSDSTNEGLQPAAMGLIKSRNTMTVRVGEFATRTAVRELARQAGLDRIPDMPSIYLGAFETTLKSLTAAYTMFPNDGVRRQPYIIDRIVDRKGRTIYRSARVELRCLTPGVDYVMNELLRDVVRKGTAATAQSLGLTVPAAGKTGTTDDYKDAWFVGYTTRLTCGVWVGMDRPQRIADRGYGSKLALPIWIDFIQNASSWKYVAKNFESPADLKIVNLCRTSGALAVSGCAEAGTSYSARLPDILISHEYCPVHGGALAGAIPETQFESAPAALTEPSAEEIPIARALPVEPEQEAPAGSYRMIRKQNGFIFQSGR